VGGAIGSDVLVAATVVEGSASAGSVAAITGGDAVVDGVIAGVSPATLDE
jgi:hypothetical protein